MYRRAIIGYDWTFVARSWARGAEASPLGWSWGISTESIDNYLKAVYELCDEGGRVSTTALAEHLNVKSPSVSAMVKRLSTQVPPLLDYESHQGVRLTQEGLKRSLEVIRHHRLIETFLYEVLGYSWDEVHEEAELLEHYISERFEERIANYLNDPKYDPHGSPIPTLEGEMPEIKYFPLTAGTINTSYRVVRVDGPNEAIQNYLYSLGIEPETALTLIEKAPFDGPISVRLDSSGAVHGLGMRAASRVMVERINS